MEHATPDTFVLATGKSSTVREFVEMAFRAIGTELSWRGSGVDEEGVCKKTGKLRVKVNPAFFRPAEVDYLIGDASRAKADARLGSDARRSRSFARSWSRPTSGETRLASRSERVLLTGSGGFTGRPLAARLRQDGHEVFGLTRTARGKRRSPRRSLRHGLGSSRPSPKCARPSSFISPASRRRSTETSANSIRSMSPGPRTCSTPWPSSPSRRSA